MEALKKKILAEGEVYEGNILKVDCFLNHQIDFPFMKEVGREFHRLYKDAGVNKILTIEPPALPWAAWWRWSSPAPWYLPKEQDQEHCRRCV